MKKQDYLSYHWPPTDIKFNYKNLSSLQRPIILPFPGMARKDSVLSETMDISVAFSLWF